ncbi:MULTISPECIES: PEP-CTERM sorting domain-containing protein [unclassified Okeania]|nr:MULTISPECIES: PEP-CTERM sorting domain-containing protein [unclassified Okeania]NES76769.1 PEP-CTERM sorting domain-containing protein [Okeania sp. SIO1H4]NET79981.1 PEP-CTERM sorting domain-containing protein [Okeania sp. SIO1F9]
MIKLTTVAKYASTAALGATLIALDTMAAQAFTLFSDRAAFDAATPSLTLEDFEDNGLADDSVFLFPVLNNATAPWIEPGLEFSSIGPATTGMVLLTEGFFGAPSDLIGPNAFVNDLNFELSFTDPINAVGFDLFGLANPGETTVTILGTSGEITSRVVPANLVGTFFGIFAPGESITAIQFSNSNPEGLGELIDNVAFTMVPVPEPASLLGLLGVSALGAISLKCKQKQNK